MYDTPDSAFTSGMSTSLRCGLDGCAMPKRSPPAATAGALDTAASNVATPAASRNARTQEARAAMPERARNDAQRHATEMEVAEAALRDERSFVPDDAAERLLTTGQFTSFMCEDIGGLCDVSLGNDPACDCQGRYQTTTQAAAAGDSCPDGNTDGFCDDYCAATFEDYFDDSADCP